MFASLVYFNKISGFGSRKHTSNTNLRFFFFFFKAKYLRVFTISNQENIRDETIKATCTFTTLKML